MNGSELPGGLELVRAFVNTRELETGADLLADSRGLQAWLTGHGLADPSRTPTEAELHRTTDLREALRAHLLANNGQPLGADAVSTLERQAARSGVTVSFADGAAVLLPTAAGVDGALGLVIAAAGQAMFEGTWPRLKACPADNCHWAFIDHSRNHSRHWCAMNVCGNRQKVRAHRARRR